jgi:hypothetical protein
MVPAEVRYIIALLSAVIRQKVILGEKSLFGVVLAVQIVLNIRFS